MKDTAKTVEEIAEELADVHAENPSIFHEECLDREDLEFMENESGEQFVSLNEVDRVARHCNRESFQKGFHAGQKVLRDQCVESLREWVLGLSTDEIEHMKTKVTYAIEDERSPVGIVWTAATIAGEKRYRPSHGLNGIVCECMTDCDCLQKEREEMLKDLEWAIECIEGNTHCEYFERKSAQLRAKWFANTKERGSDEAK